MQNVEFFYHALRYILIGDHKKIHSAEPSQQVKIYIALRVDLKHPGTGMKR